MDIEYLLWLQGIREALGPAIEAFMNLISHLGGAVMLAVIPCLLYWIVDKDLGMFILVNMGIGNNINQTIKDTACVYRPWIRDARISPSQAALGHATGYSFPSGHTQGSGSVFGSLAWRLRENTPKASKLLVFLVLLIGFSRSYLGVHTPQDVFVALAVAGVTIYLSERFIAWVRRDATKDTTVLAAGLAVVAIIVVYTTVKPYPMDYADGVLLVDPEAMRLDGYSNAGLLGGMLVGWFLENRYVRFSTNCSTRKKVVRVVVCLAMIGAFMGLVQLIKLALGRGAVYAVAKGAVPAFTGVFAGPAISAPLEKRFAPSDRESSRESE